MAFKLEFFESRSAKRVKILLEDGTVKQEMLSVLVSSLQVKWRPPSLSNMQGIPPFKPKLPVSLTWTCFFPEHPSFDFAKSCLQLVPPQQFWSISRFYPDLICFLQVQIRLTG